MRFPRAATGATAVVMPAGTHLDDLEVEAAERVEADQAVADFWGLSDQPAEGEPEPDAGTDATDGSDAEAQEIDGDDGDMPQADEPLGSVADELAAGADSADGETEAAPETPARKPFWSAEYRDRYDKAREERDMRAFHSLSAQDRHDVRAKWEAEDNRAATRAAPVQTGPPADVVSAVDAILAAEAADDAWALAEAQRGAPPEALIRLGEYKQYRQADPRFKEVSYADSLRIYAEYQAQQRLSAVTAAVDPEAVFTRYQSRPEWAQFTDAQKDALDPTHAAYADMTPETAALAMAERWGQFVAAAERRAQAAPHVERLRNQQQRADRVQAAANGAVPRAPQGQAPTPRTYNAVRDAFLANKDNPDPAVADKARKDFEAASVARWR